MTDRRCASGPRPYRTAAVVATFLSGSILTAALSVPSVAEYDRTAAYHPVARMLQSRFSAPSPGDHGDPQLHPDLQRFYGERDYRPLWVGPAGPGPLLRDLVKVLGGAAREGLTPSDYGVNRLEQGLQGDADPGDMAELELISSRTFARYLSDLRSGRQRPHDVDPELFHEPAEIDLAAVLSTVERFGVAALVERHTPSNAVYRRLRRALAEYRRIADGGGWPNVPADGVLREGSRGEAVARLRERLMASGDLTVRPAEDAYFGEGLTLAVQRFQQRHGLAADGVVGPKTAGAMNVSVEQRIEQIVVNMERWRWMADDLGERYILVNLAGFELEVVESGSVVLSMRVVVGQPYRRTPVFSDRMTYLEINPYWTVPQSIARKDLIPKVKTDPKYLSTQGFRVFAGWSADAPEIDPAMIDWASAATKSSMFRFRQEPGPNNALGRIKFMFPNKFSIYLHDTPSRNLFDKVARAFSSGCIRVQWPLDLAEYALADVPGWSRARIENEIASGRTTAVRLASPMPVHLTYSTAWIGEGGSIEFREDVYGRDKLLLKALYGRESRRRTVY